MNGRGEISLLGTFIAPWHFVIAAVSRCPGFLLMVLLIQKPLQEGSGVNFMYVHMHIVVVYFYALYRARTY